MPTVEICSFRAGAGSAVVNASADGLGAAVLTVIDDDGFVVLRGECDNLSCFVESWGHVKTRRSLRGLYVEYESSKPTTVTLAARPDHYSCVLGSCQTSGIVVTARLNVDANMPEVEPEPSRVESRRYRNGPGGTNVLFSCRDEDEPDLGGACFEPRPGDSGVEITIDGDDAAAVGAAYEIYRGSTLRFQGEFCGSTGYIDFLGHVIDRLYVRIPGPQHCASSESGTVNVLFNGSA